MKLAIYLSQWIRATDVQMLGAVGGRKAPYKSWLVLWVHPTEIRLLSSFPGLALSMLCCTYKIVWFITQEPMEQSLKANSPHSFPFAGFPLNKNICVQCKGTHTGNGLISIAMLLSEANSFHRGLPKPLSILVSSKITIMDNSTLPLFIGRGMATENKEAIYPSLCRLVP